MCVCVCIQRCQRKFLILSHIWFRSLTPFSSYYIKGFSLESTEIQRTRTKVKHLDDSKNYERLWRFSYLGKFRRGSGIFRNKLRQNRTIGYTHRARVYRTWRNYRSKLLFSPSTRRFGEFSILIHHRERERRTQVGCFSQKSGSMLPRIIEARFSVMTVGRGMKSARAFFPGEKFTGVSPTYISTERHCSFSRWNLSTKRFSALSINKVGGCVLRHLRFPRRSQRALWFAIDNHIIHQVDEFDVYRVSWTELS